MVAPVVNLPSDKHSGISGLDTQLFCQHSGETPLRGGYAESLTRNNNADPNWQASWPSFVDPIARVRQIAWPNSAWTQGYANNRAVGLECAGYAHFTAAQWLTAEGVKQLENLAHEWVYYWKLEEAAGNKIPLRWLTDAEVAKVMAGNRDIKGFCTHRQIDPGSRSDPGPNFPYGRLLNRIAELLGKTSATAASTTKPTPIQTDWFDTLDEKTLTKILDTRIDAGIQRLLNYDNTTRSDRTLYALLIDGGLNATDAKKLIEAVRKDVADIKAQNAGLTAAVTALAEAKGIDPAAITNTVETSVRDALAGLSITLTTEDAPAPNEKAEAN
ncbi:N-acetylmuramoyl-L-alanine amidase [Arthrobacter sp. USHLN218]|uniref:N-acetylmuramoyl-L-alanine amidase n=1 Tax=Arthrobacter sp. USHLN218 TaxID=3081232 RepID=UPI003015C6AA